MVQCAHQTSGKWKIKIFFRHFAYIFGRLLIKCKYQSISFFTFLMKPTRPKFESHEAQKFKFETPVLEQVVFSQRLFLHSVPEIVALITVRVNAGLRAYVGHNSWHMR